MIAVVSSKDRLQYLAAASLESGPARLSCCYDNLQLVSFPAPQSNFEAKDR